MKNRFSKFMSIILVLALAFALLPTAAFAATRSDWYSGTWTGISSWPTSGGHYYLTDDFSITKSGTNNVAVSGTVYLDLNGHTITFKGNSSYAAIDIKNGSALYLYDSSNGNGKIMRDSSAGYANGVYIDHGTFVMNGGIISGFKNASDGGGVRVYNYGSFTMNGGQIYDNAASNSGGGVGVSDNSKFKMTGGSIHGNSTKTTSQYAYGGGGVALWYGASFEMTGGDIYSNQSVQFGGGVMHNSTGEFKMSGGYIDYNNAREGGGVYLVELCKMIMSGGKIYSNTAQNSGGGVAVAGGRFEMSGGEIYSNKTNSTSGDTGGGGVAVWWAGGFEMTGGKLYNNTSARYGGAVMSNNDGSGVTINGGEIGSNSGTYTSGIQKIGGNGSVTYTKGRFYTGNSYNPSLSGTSAITFNQNGGSGGTTSYTATWNVNLPNITASTRAGYTFNGYYNSNGDKYYNADGTPYNKTYDGTKWDYIGAQTLTASWTAIKYNIAFDPNGGADAPANVAATYDANSTIPTETPSNAGYFFKEWNTKQDGSGTSYTSGATVKNLAATNGETVTLYAQWSNDDAHHGIVDLTSVTDDEATENETENAMTFDVLATATTGQGDAYADITYYVTIAWSVDVSSIDIKEGTVYEWSTTELKYVPVSGDGALIPGGSAATTVTVTNRSNAAVSYDISFNNATATTGLTTSEAKAEASTDDSSGTLNSADLNGASSDATGSGHVYKIDAANIDATGNAEQSAEYKGTVTVTAIASGTTIEDNADLTLGTYTVTLGAPTADSGEIK